MILDTSFLGDLKSQDSNAKQKAIELELSGKPLRIPSIVFYELFISIGKTSITKYKILDQRAYKKLSASKPTVELSEEIANRAGIIEGVHQRSNDKPELGAGDAIVAATGLQFQEPVVANDGDFGRVEGLRVETY
jgi:predicted nucleic acid-binding protein